MVEQQPILQKQTHFAKADQLTAFLVRLIAVIFIASDHVFSAWFSFENALTIVLTIITVQLYGRNRICMREQGCVWAGKCASNPAHA